MSVQTFQKVKQVFAAKVRERIPVDNDMVDAVLAERRRNATHTFDACLVAIADQEHSASNEFDQFFWDRSIASAERGDDADFRQYPRAMRELECGQRVFAAFKNENDIASVVLDHVQQADQLVPVCALRFAAHISAVIQTARRSVVDVAESPLVRTRKRKQSATGNFGDGLRAEKRIRC